jgi:hypothetical protein
LPRLPDSPAEIIPDFRSVQTDPSVIAVNNEESQTQSATLRWAKIAGWAGIASLIVSMVGIWVQK